MPTPAEQAANKAFREAASNAFAARRNYDARRAQRRTRDATLERARADWGCAEVTRIGALVALAEAEDAELVRDQGTA